VLRFAGRPLADGLGGLSFTTCLNLDRQLEGTNTATLVGLSLNVAREWDFVMKLNALMVRYIVNDVDEAIGLLHPSFGVSRLCPIGSIFRDSRAGEFAARIESTPRTRRGIATDAGRPQP
jgi:hypothetical protein